MAYVRKKERYEKLKADFLKKAAPYLSEYELLGEYINKDTKTLFRHKVCGNEFMMAPHNFKAGHGCPKCALEKKAESLRRTKGSKLIDFINAHPDEYTLQGRYINVRTPINVLHKTCGRVFTRIPSTFYNTGFTGELCTLCAREKDAKEKRISLEEANARLKIKNPEYEFLSYAGAHKQATVKHSPCGYVFDQEAYYLLVGNGHCPKCTTNISRQEKEIYKWLVELGVDVEQCAHDVPNVSEVDLLIRDKSVGIEFNGHWWHSVQCMTRPDPKTGKPRMSYAEAKKYHYLKSFWCEKAGVRLIHIWDYEWADERKRKVLKNIILGALGMLPERYFARKTTVHHYERGCARWHELCQFFAENNIQGDRGGSHVFTLENDDGRVLMAYKFGRPSGGRAKKLYEYEMVRGASAPGVQVVGGASKLWKHFVDEMRPNSVVYYIDYNYFDGKSVEKLGGKFLTSQPGVKNYWIESGEVKNREPSRHKEVKQAIEDGKCLELWNAGTKTYVFNY